MHNLWLWMPSAMLVATFVYVALSSRLKGRAAVIVSFTYFWGTAAVLSVVTWQLQRGRAEIDAQMDPDNPYTADIITNHHQELWMLLVQIIVLFVIPIIFYWFDRRKQRRAALSATTV